MLFYPLFPSPDTCFFAQKVSLLRTGVQKTSRIKVAFSSDSTYHRAMRSTLYPVGFSPPCRHTLYPSTSHPLSLLFLSTAGLWSCCSSGWLIPAHLLTAHIHPTSSRYLQGIDASAWCSVPSLSATQCYVVT